MFYQLRMLYNYFISSFNEVFSAAYVYMLYSTNLITSYAV